MSDERLKAADVHRSSFIAHRSRRIIVVDERKGTMAKGNNARKKETKKPKKDKK